MSLKLERQIAKLSKELDAERKRIDWIINQMKNGMSELATVTVTKILEEGLEAEVVEKTVDEQLKDEWGYWDETLNPGSSFETRS